MFYEIKNQHGLPHDPIKAIIAPRPIAWIGTRVPESDNLAPFSFFTQVSATQIAVSISPDMRGEDRKDTLKNIRETGVFSVSIASRAHAQSVAKSGSSAPPEIDEFTWTETVKAECELINAPRVSDAPACLECALSKEIDLGSYTLIIGEILAVHMRDDLIENGIFQTQKAEILARMGYLDYTWVSESQEIPTPKFTG